MKLPPAYNNDQLHSKLDEACCLLTSQYASISLKEEPLSIEPMAPFHASPMLMAPSWRGDTRTPAVELRIRYLPNSVGGSGAGLKMSDMLAVRVGLFLSPVTLQKVTGMDRKEVLETAREDEVFYSIYTAATLCHKLSALISLSTYLNRSCLYRTCTLPLLCIFPLFP